MTYIIKDITPEEREQILEETRAVRELGRGINLNERLRFLLNKKKDSDNYYDRILNEANGNYFMNIGNDGREDMLHNRYLFYYYGKTYLLAIVTGSDWAEGRLRYFGSEPPQGDKELEQFLTELGQAFRINGTGGRGWDDDNPRTQFIPKILIKKEAPWL